jgi:hypothetical protein
MICVWKVFGDFQKFTSIADIAIYQWLHYQTKYCDSSKVIKMCSRADMWLYLLFIQD